MLKHPENPPRSATAILPLSLSLSLSPELRLVDGSDVCEGRLEFAQSDGSYVQGCGAEVDNRDAMVVCRQLGCDSEGAQRVDITQ